jgi:hypothetical protein
MAGIELTAEERENLETLEGKLRHVRDAVRGVVREFHTGLVLWGEGGTGKSYTVLEALKELKAKYTYHNTRMTGRGLVDALGRAPSDIHFIEDAETMLDDKRAWGVLRSALWSQSRKKPPEREITWTAFQVNIRFIFTGGVIIVSNSNLAESVPAIRAIKSRITVLGLDLSNNEIRALMKKICQDGYSYGEYYMSPDECWEVGGWIIDRLEDLKRKLDVRLLINGFKDYLQYKTGNSVSDWKQLLEGRMREQAIYVNRAEQKAEESKVALEIHKMKLPVKKKIRLWKERTGLGQAAYYRALDRLQAKRR